MHTFLPLYIYPVAQSLLLTFCGHKTSSIVQWAKNKIHTHYNNDHEFVSKVEHDEKLRARLMREFSLVAEQEPWQLMQPAGLSEWLPQPGTAPRTVSPGTCPHSLADHDPHQQRSPTLAPVHGHPETDPGCAISKFFVNEPCQSNTE